MYIVQVEQETLHYNSWKSTFDADPIGRKEQGVRRYWIGRAATNENHVVINLEVETRDQADAMVSALEELWKHMEADIIAAPTARVYEVVTNVVL